MDSHARLHAELVAFLRQRFPVADQRHLVLVGWMVTGLLLSQTVSLDQWKRSIPLGHCLASSWQRRCRRWLSNGRIDVSSLNGPLVLWKRFCVVVLSVVCHGRAIPLLWKTLEHPSASISAEVVIALLQRADRLLVGFSAITVLADRAFPSAGLLGWLEDRSRWHYVMRLWPDTWIRGTAAPMGCEVRRLRLPTGHCRGFRSVGLWDRAHQAHLVLARPVGITAAEPWYLVSDLEPSLDLVWAQGRLKVRHKAAGAAMLVPIFSGLLPSVSRPRCHC